jgi:hypothetical protein
MEMKIHQQGSGGHTLEPLDRAIDLIASGWRLNFKGIRQKHNLRAGVVLHETGTDEVRHLSFHHLNRPTKIRRCIGERESVEAFPGAVLARLEVDAKDADPVIPSA